MSPQQIVDVLNRLLALHNRSLPIYLSSAKPWSKARESRGTEVLRRIAEDQQFMIEQLGSEILREGGTPDLGEFPMEFTDLHDLSIEYLVQQVSAAQRREIEVIREAVRQLADAPRARAVAEEALGAAQGHLESLLELRQPVPAL